MFIVKFGMYIWTCKTLGFCSLRTSKIVLPNPTVSNDKIYIIVCIKEHVTLYELDLGWDPIPLAKNLKSLEL